MIALVRKRLGSVLIVGLLGLAAVAAPAYAQEESAPEAIAAEAGPTVVAMNVQFAPTPLTVPAGSTVTWTNMDPFQHTVSADDGSFDSGLIEAGGVFSLAFAEPGVYAYYCMPHGAPGGIGMSGTITVE